MRATRCSVCQHQRRIVADSMIAGGASLASVSKALGVTTASVRYHRARGHVVGPTLGAVPINSEKATGTPQEQLEGLRDRLDGMLASGTLSPAVTLDVIAERRRIVETMNRVVGPQMAAPPTLDDVPGWREVQAAMFDALEPWPEARKALWVALRR